MLTPRYRIACDRCPESATLVYGSRERAVAKFRESGWTIGNTDLCPSCAGGPGTTGHDRSLIEVVANATRRALILREEYAIMQTEETDSFWYIPQELVEYSSAKVVALIGTDGRPK